MSPLNDAEFKTYLAKAREKRATVLQSGAAEAKLDVSGVTICKLKRKGGGNSEEGSPSLSDTEPIVAPPLNNEATACDSKVVLPLPRKKIKKEKTCVPMEETDKASLWDRSFDGVGFVDSNLSFTKDAHEVKEFGLEKASEMLVAYNLRSALLGKVIMDQFQSVLGHESNRRDKLNATKEKLKIANDILGDMKKQILKVNKRLEEEQTALTQLEKKTENNKAFEEEVVGLKKSVNTLKGQSAAKDMEIEDLKLVTAFRYQDGFDKAIEQVHVLFPSFDLSEADAMKSVVNGKLV